MKKNLDRVKEWARDLRVEEPRSAAEELAGFPMGRRCLDKCRASLLGWQGDYTFGCPLDREFLQEAGLDQEEFKDFVASGASDQEVENWVRERSHATS